MRQFRCTFALIALASSLFAPNAAAEPATAIERLELDSEPPVRAPTGQGVQIVILSEAADAAHPHLQQRDIGQWHVRFGEDGQPGTPIMANPVLFLEDWHGTHVTGILGTDCSLGRFRGVACASDLTIHDFGAYGDFPYNEDDAAKGMDPETAFLRRLAASLRHSVGNDIANLSFNVEAPYVPVELSGGAGRSIGAILSATGVAFDDLFTALPSLIDDGGIVLTNRHDAAFLDYVADTHNDPPALVYGLLLPASSEWHDLETAFGEFQNAGGVIVISESNNRFEGRSGVLNAMPSLSRKVSSGGWVSAVYVKPDGAGGYEAPLNGCGRLAANYCIAVRADDVVASVPGGELTRAESGHSMAAPMLSGVLALLVEQGRRENPDFDARSALSIIKDTARRDFPAYDPLIHGLGLLDARAALSAIGTERGQEKLEREND